MRIGFFGGAFDPIHKEHRQIIECAAAELKLDKVVVYPSYAPPHKLCTAPFDARCELVKLALKDLDYVTIDCIEKDRNSSVNPTCEVLPILKEKYGADENYFIMGGDSMLNFSKWIAPEKIANTMDIAVVARERKEEVVFAAKRAEEDFNAKVTVLSYVGKTVSGSLIKAAIALGDSPDTIERSVYDKIIELNLYRENEELIAKLKENIPQRTFEHVKRTVYYALKLNVRLGLGYQKVFIAALFHDCAKHLHRAMDGVPSAVEHQFLGRETAATVYGIEDKEILSAIEFHTTGKPEMTKLEKLVFCADMLEEGRNYSGVDELRKKIEENFEEGFIACVNASLKVLKDNEKPVYPLTEACARYYNTNKVQQLGDTE